MPKPPPNKPATNDRPKRPSKPRQHGSKPAVGFKPAAGAKASGKPATRQAMKTAPARIAKAMADAGLCSRREAEQWIAHGRVSVNGEVLASPALAVTPSDIVLVDGEPLPQAEATRLWLLHKPRGLVTTTHDPDGRPTVFTILPKDMPRVISVGRLDINTEGLLLLTNDGALARTLELPAQAMARGYRVRAYGKADQSTLDRLAEGMEVDGVKYGSIDANFERAKGDNQWMSLTLREGKNREIKRVLEALGLTVNRLIRVSFGPFTLGDIKPGALIEVPHAEMARALGNKLAGTLRKGPRRTIAAEPEAPKAEPAKPAGKPAPKSVTKSAPKSSTEPRKRGGRKGKPTQADILDRMDRPKGKGWAKVRDKDKDKQGRPARTQRSASSKPGSKPNARRRRPV